MEKMVLTVVDVAKMLSLNPLTIYRLAQKGDIPAVKIGRCWRFTREAIDEWLEQKSWRQRLERILKKVWKNTKNIPQEVIDELTAMGYTVALRSGGVDDRPGSEFPGPLCAIGFDWEHQTLLGGVSFERERHGIAW